MPELVLPDEVPALLPLLPEGDDIPPELLPPEEELPDDVEVEEELLVGTVLHAPSAIMDTDRKRYLSFVFIVFVVRALPVIL